MASRPTSGTSSRSSTSRDSGAGDARAHTAVHVVKGAVARVLGPRKFTYGEEVDGRSGVLRAEGKVRPTPQEVARIEVTANEKVAEDAEVLEFEMEREEAEGHFGKGIYDLGSAPKEGELLRVVRIDDWEVSCCGKSHVGSTGSVGAVRIDKVALDEDEKELEIGFHLL